MRITGIKATPVGVPLEEVKSKSRMRIGPRLMVAVIVEVFTDEGITGIGETPAILGPGLSAEYIKSAGNILIGRDPTDINKLMKILYTHYNLAHLHIHAGNWALSGIDLALWDIAGKRARMPLYQLWGGAYRKKINFYGHVERQDPDEMKKQASEFVKKGFTTIFTKVGFDHQDDIDAVAAMRAGAPGRDIKIRVDANQAWSTGEAVVMINKMAEYGLEFVDQPVLMYNLDALKTVKDKVSVPIAAHESGWTMYDILNVIKKDAADYIHIDTRFDAGFVGARISAGMAEAAGIQCIAHSYFEMGPIFAANLHFIASCPNFTLANQLVEYQSLKSDVIKGGPLKFQGSYVEVPEGHGIGIELDQDLLGIYNELYIKEILEKGLETGMDNHLYGAMYLRPYLKDEWSWKNK